MKKIFIIIVILCLTAANILITNGFKEVYDMGGISDWQAQGYPVVVGE